MLIRSAVVVGLVLASVPACAGNPDPAAVPRGSLAHAPCHPRLVAAVLDTDEPFTREERAYLQRCGVRFASAPATPTAN